jgi:hypothetical protein
MKRGVLLQNVGYHTNTAGKDASWFVKVHAHRCFVQCRMLSFKEKSLTALPNRAAACWTDETAMPVLYRREFAIRSRWLVSDWSRLINGTTSLMLQLTSPVSANSCAATSGNIGRSQLSPSCSATRASAMVSDSTVGCCVSVTLIHPIPSRLCLDRPRMAYRGTPRKVAAICDHP